MNKLIVFFLVSVTLLSATTVLAVRSNTIKICHRTDSHKNPYIVNHPEKSGDVSGHDGHNGGVYPDDPWGDIIPPFDYGDSQHYPGKNWTTDGQAIWNNECNIPSVTPTPTPTKSITPTPTVIPCSQDSILPCPSPTPTTSVTPTPTETVTPTPGNNPPSNPLPPESSHTTFTPECSALPATKVHDVWYSNYTVEGNYASLVLHWGLNNNYGTVNIVYGEQKGAWQYGATNVPNTGSYLIGYLKPHQTYWFQVAYNNNCRPGEYSDPIDP